MGKCQGLPKFLDTPIISGRGEATDFRCGRYIRRVHSNKNSLKFWRKKGAWADPGTAQISGVQPSISGTGKATNFKFCTHIYRTDQNKSPLKNSGKV